MKGHIRARGPGAWEIKFDVERDPATGKRKTRYLTVRGTKKDAQRELTRQLNQIAAGTYVDPGRLTVAEHLEHWLQHHARHRVSAKTFERYAEIVRKHLVPAIGAHPLGKLAPAHIEAYYSAALTEPRFRTTVKKDGTRTTKTLPPLSARTVKHHHRVLSQALKHAVRHRRIVENPCLSVDPPRPRNQEMKILDQAQTAALLRLAEPSPIYVPVLLAVTTGMRRGELLALRWRDVDLERRSLSVNQTLEQTKAGLAFKEPKTERSRRTISLPALTVEALRRHRVHQAEALLAFGIKQDGETLVCCNALGEPLSPRAVSQAFFDLVKKLNLRVRFHDLRHTHISHLLAAGVHPKVASERAGHASVSITLDVYSHVIPGMQEDAAMKIDAALRAHLDG